MLFGRFYFYRRYCVILWNFCVILTKSRCYFVNLLTGRKSAEILIHSSLLVEFAVRLCESICKWCILRRYCTGSMALYYVCYSTVELPAVTRISSNMWLFKFCDVCTSGTTVTVHSLLQILSYCISWVSLYYVCYSLPPLLPVTCLPVYLL